MWPTTAQWPTTENPIVFRSDVLGLFADAVIKSVFRPVNRHKISLRKMKQWSAVGISMVGHCAVVGHIVLWKGPKCRKQFYTHYIPIRPQHSEARSSDVADCTTFAVASYSTSVVGEISDQRWTVKGESGERVWISAELDWNSISGWYTLFLEHFLCVITHSPRI